MLSNDSVSPAQQNHYTGTSCRKPDNPWTRAFHDFSPCSLASRYGNLLLFMVPVSLVARIYISPPQFIWVTSGITVILLMAQYAYRTLQFVADEDQLTGRASSEKQLYDDLEEARKQALPHISIVAVQCIAGILAAMAVAVTIPNLRPVFPGISLAHAAGGLTALIWMPFAASALFLLFDYWNRAPTGNLSRPYVLGAVIRAAYFGVAGAYNVLIVVLISPMNVWLAYKWIIEWGAMAFLMLQFVVPICCLSRFRESGTNSLDEPQSERPSLPESDLCSYGVSGGTIYAQNLAPSGLMRRHFIACTIATFILIVGSVLYALVRYLPACNPNGSIGSMVNMVAVIVLIGAFAIPLLHPVIRTLKSEPIRAGRLRFLLSSGSWIILGSSVVALVLVLPIHPVFDFTRSGDRVALICLVLGPSLLLYLSIMLLAGRPKGALHIASWLTAVLAGLGPLTSISAYRTLNGGAFIVSAALACVAAIITCLCRSRTGTRGKRL